MMKMRSLKRNDDESRSLAAIIFSTADQRTCVSHMSLLAYLIAHRRSPIHFEYIIERLICCDSDISVNNR